MTGRSDDDALASIRPPCLLCGHGRRGDASLHHLTHGIAVWLCATHSDDAFTTRNGGHDFVEGLATRWIAGGNLGVRRRTALRAHLRRIANAGVGRERPGSYSWPMLRREAERRFAAGEPPAEVIADLRDNHRDGPAIVPSIRTMRRWFTQGRWLQVTLERASRRTPVLRPAKPGTQWTPLVNLIVTGVAYPSSPAPRRRYRPRSP